MTVHAPGSTLSTLYDVCLPKEEIASSKVADMTEKLVDNLKLSNRLMSTSLSGDGEKTAAANDEGESHTAGDTFVQKQAMTFIDLIMSVKDNPEVPYSELTGIVFALRHLMQQSGWKPTSVSLPHGFIDILIRLISVDDMSSSMSSKRKLGGENLEESVKAAKDVRFLLAHMVGSGEPSLVTSILTSLLTHVSFVEHSDSYSKSKGALEDAVFLSLFSRTLHAYLWMFGAREKLLCLTYESQPGWRLMDWSLAIMLG